MKRWRPSFMRSIYARTILMMALFILILFVILGSVYYGLSNAVNRQQQADSLLRSTLEIGRLVSLGMSRDRLAIDDNNVPGYIVFTARSTNALVWVVNAEGTIIFDTGLPLSTHTLLMGDQEIPHLPVELQNDDRVSVCLPAGRTAFSAILPREQKWLVATTPIQSTTGAYAGEVLLLQTTVPITWGAFLQSNAVPISFFVAFFLALIIIIWLSKHITEPIAELAATAEKVNLGDLKARAGVEADGHVPTLADSDVAGADDLMLLIRTFNSLVDNFESSEKERQDFMNSIAHDLRTPLTSLKGFVEGMRDGTIPESRFPHYLSIVAQETNRLQGLVNTLFSVVLSHEKQRLTMEAVDFNEVLKDSLVSLEPQLRRHDLSVVRKLAGDEEGGMIVRADETALVRILTNILINAIRFSPTGGTIEIETRERHEELMVRIADQGPGVPAGDEVRIFEQFYKTDQSRGSEGSGLGLYITRNLVLAHGHRIAAHNRPEGGLLVVFSLALETWEEREADDRDDSST